MHDARAARALCLHWLALSTFSLSLSSFFSHSSEDLPNSDDVKDLKERRQKGNDNKIDNKKSLKDRNKKEYDIISKSNCLRPACSDIEKKMQSSLAGLSESVVGLGSKNSIGIAGDLGPIGKEQLGRSTWNLLHTIGSNYPENPPKELQNSALNFISSLALLYPCPYCGKDFRGNIVKNPPRVESRTALSLWLCEQHNEVNKKIGKSIFPCNIEALDQRWGASETEVEDEDDENTLNETAQQKVGSSSNT